MAEISSPRVWPLGVTAKQWTVTVVEPERDDRALTAAARAGDTQAFDTIVERHRRAVYQVCYRFVNNHEDASDLTQETFVRAWKGLAAFKGEAALATWLYRIAVNVSLNCVKGRRRDAEPIEDHQLIDVNAAVPGDELVRQQRAAAVREAIASLPEKQRATLILRTYQELPHQQIADILGSSVGAVKANYFHALANLKKILGSEP